MKRTRGALDGLCGTEEFSKGSLVACFMVHNVNLLFFMKSSVNFVLITNKKISLEKIRL